MNSTSTGDSHLMGEVSAGNVEAFGVLYDRFCDRAYGVAFSVCRDEGRAQDAVQEAFLSLWKSRASYRPQHGTVAAWLLVVVHNRAIHVARRNGNHAARWASSNRPDEHPAPDNVSGGLIHGDEAERVRSALAHLSDEQREVITLAYYGQLSHSKIAAHLDLPSGTVKSRIRLALNKLRATIDMPRPDIAVPSKPAFDRSDSPQAAWPSRAE